MKRLASNLAYFDKRLQIPFHFGRNLLGKAYFLALQLSLGSDRATTNLVYSCN